MQLPIIIGLHRSSFLQGVFLVVALAALVAVALLPLSRFWLSVGILLLLPMQVIVWFRLRALPGQLRLERDGGISLREAENAEFRPAICLPGATVHPVLCVFRLRESGSGKTHVVLVTADSASADEFRRLRVFLRWRAVFSCSPSVTE